MMTKLQSTKVLTILFFAFFSSLYPEVFAQNTRNVSISGFTAIGVSSGINLHLTQGSTEAVVIKGDEDAIKDIVVEKKAESINVKYRDGINWSRLFQGKEINVYVTFKNLYAIAASGGSDVFNTGTFKTDRLALSSSGGADIELALTCKNITIATSGGSDVSLKGSAENMVVSASGGSDIDAFDFKVDYAKVSTSGGSDVNIYVNKALTANASGGSDITYKGNAALKKTSNSKIADITHIK